MNPNNAIDSYIPAPQRADDKPATTGEAALTVNINGGPPVGATPIEEIEGLSYVPVPPLKSVIVSVRYLVRGRGRPLPYPQDAGDAE